MNAHTKRFAGYQIPGFFMGFGFFAYPPFGRRID